MTVENGRKKVPPIVPKKNQQLKSATTHHTPITPPSTSSSSLSSSNDKIIFPHLVPRQDERIPEPKSLADLVNSISLASEFDVPKRNNKEPKAIKYEDVIKPVSRNDIKISHRLHSVPSPIRHKPLLKPKPQLNNIQIVSKAKTVNQFVNHNGQIMVALPGMVNKHATELPLPLSGKIRPFNSSAKKTAHNSTSELNKDPQTLRHLNKNRSRGPKRNQRKGREKDQKNFTKKEDVQITVNKKLPPPPPKKPKYLTSIS